MTGCYTCGGGMGKHDPVAHGWVREDNNQPCNGICVMGNEVMPGEPAHQGHNDDPRGGYYDWAAYPHPDCPRHGDGFKPVEDSLSGWWYMRPGESMDEHAARLKADPRWEN